MSLENPCKQPFTKSEREPWEDVSEEQQKERRKRVKEFIDSISLPITAEELWKERKAANKKRRTEINGHYLRHFSLEELQAELEARGIPQYAADQKEKNGLMEPYK